MVDKNGLENKGITIVGSDSSAGAGKGEAGTRSTRAKRPPPAVRGDVCVEMEPMPETDAPIARRSGRIPLG
jgi:hypothetical protein